MHRHSITWLAIFIVITLMFLRLPQMTAKQDTVLNTYAALVEVDALAKQKYVAAIDSDRLVDGAIRGLLRQLDPYSGYIPHHQLAAFERRSSGDYIGVGIEVGLREGKLIVIAPVEGSPAAKAGVLAGDRMLAIDGHDIKGFTVFDVEELLSGPPGTTVRLRVRHRDHRDPVALTVIRGPVSLVTIKGSSRKASGGWDYLIDPDRRIGYVRVSNFRNNTMRDFDAALAKLADQNARALVIDLRFNPGGIMQQAIAMVDRFVDRGLILSTVTRRKAVQQYQATSAKSITDMKLAVLINGGSASSAEIVAGSLQALDRVVVIGEQSFGKGSVQHLIYLTERPAAIKLTTAYYRLPDGRIIHRTERNAATDSWGVTPDVLITLTNDEVRAIQTSRRLVDTGLTSAEDPAAGTAEPEVLLDRQLAEALSQLSQQLSEEPTSGS